MAEWRSISMVELCGPALWLRSRSQGLQSRSALNQHDVELSVMLRSEAHGRAAKHLDGGVVRAEMLQSRSALNQHDVELSVMLSPEAHGRAAMHLDGGIAGSVMLQSRSALNQHDVAQQIESPTMKTPSPAFPKGANRASE